MARWRKGEQQVASLMEQRHLQQVAADSQSAAALLASAGRHVESARRTVDADPEAAYALAYDAARKSATALLAHQGLRPTTSGGHIAVVDAVHASSPASPGLPRSTGSEDAATRPSTPIPQATTPSLSTRRTTLSRRPENASQAPAGSCNWTN